MCKIMWPALFQTPEMLYKLKRLICNSCHQWRGELNVNKQERLHKKLNIEINAYNHLHAKKCVMWSPRAEDIFTLNIHRQHRLMFTGREQSLTRPEPNHEYMATEISVAVK